MDINLNSDDLDLVVELAGEVVAVVAPAEVPMVELTATSYLMDPRGSERRIRQGKEILGFGADEVLAVTPFALPVAAVVVQSLLGEFTKAFTEPLAKGASSRARSRLKRLLRRPNQRVMPEDLEEPLTAEQTERVRLVAYKKAIELGLSGERSDLLADAVVGRLAAPDSV
jgi:hypothetical protein